MKHTGLQRREDNLQFLRSVPLLQNLREEMLMRIADVLEVVSHERSCNQTKNTSNISFTFFRGPHSFYMLEKNNIIIAVRVYIYFSCVWWFVRFFLLYQQRFLYTTIIRRLIVYLIQTTVYMIQKTNNYVSGKDIKRCHECKHGLWTRR